VKVETIITTAALVAGFGLLAYGVIAERRPRTSLNPRLIPTTPVMFAGVIIILLALLHFATIFGIQLPSRR
jgi:energy-converting hydrogenase Eha subunit A